MNKYAIDVPLKKGEVIIQHQSLINSFHRNDSFFKKRIAFKITLRPIEINLYEIAYFHPENNKVEIFGGR